MKDNNQILFGNWANTSFHLILLKCPMPQVSIRPLRVAPLKGWCILPTERKENFKFLKRRLRRRRQEISFAYTTCLRHGMRRTHAAGRRAGERGRESIRRALTSVFFRGPKRRVCKEKIYCFTKWKTIVDHLPESAGRNYVRVPLTISNYCRV